MAEVIRPVEWQEWVDETTLVVKYWDAPAPVKYLGVEIMSKTFVHGPGESVTVPGVVGFRPENPFSGGS